MSEVGSYTRGIEDAMHGVMADLRRLRGEALAAADNPPCCSSSLHAGRALMCEELLERWGFEVDE